MTGRTYGTRLPGMPTEALGGKLVVVEGPDGSGRTTEVALLKSFLEVEGHAVVDTGLRRSDLVSNEIDRAKQGHTLGATTLALLYAVDFADQLENKIIPALAAGSTVLADRYRTLIRPLWLSLVAATLLWAVLGVVKGTLPEALGLLVLGFFFMATLPLALDLSARSVPRSAEGAANAVVWEFSQIGGFALIFVFSGLGGAPVASTWTLTFFLASGLCAVMLVLGLLLRPP